MLPGHQPLGTDGRRKPRHGAARKKRRYSERVAHRQRAGRSRLHGVTERPPADASNGALLRSGCERSYEQLPLYGLGIGHPARHLPRIPSGVGIHRQLPVRGPGK